jgi:hypothetical protein
VVYGKDVYKFIKKLDNDTFKIQYKEITAQKNILALELSTDITCQAWLADGRFILCNEKGQIILMESNGDYKQFTISAHNKQSVPITAVIPYGNNGDQTSKHHKSGFVVASLGGNFRVFIKSDSESRQPYKRVDGNDLFPLLT